MATKKTVELIESYSKVCNEIVQAFAKKHDMDFNYWVGDETGGVAALADYFFDLTDILHDLKTSQKKWFIVKWQEDSVEAHFKGISDTINYKSYCMGARYDLLTKNEQNNETNH